MFAAAKAAAAALIAISALAVCAIFSPIASAADVVNTTITAKPAAITSSTSASFSFTASRSGSRFQCALDGASFSNCNSPKSYKGLAAGTHTFKVRAIYLIWTDPTPATYSWTIDRTAPDTTITTGPAALVNTPTVSFTLASTEANSTFRCRIDGGAYAACSSPFSATLAPGTHTLFAAAVDAAGNVDASPALRAFTIHTASPQTTITSGPPASGPDPNVSFTISSSAATLPYPPGCDVRYMVCAAVVYPISTTLQCSLDGAAFAPCTSVYTAGPLAAGSHVFSARAIDEAGNVDTTPATASFVITPPGDTTPPDTTITSGPPTFSNQSAASFSFVSSESPSTFRCKIGTGAYNACTSPIVISGLNGTQTVFVAAVDAAGNVDPTPAQRSFTVWTTPPETTIMSGPPASGSDPNVSFTIGASSGSLPYPPGCDIRFMTCLTMIYPISTTLECSLDGAAFAPCSSVYTAGPLSVGQHTFSARARDEVGNIDPTPATASFEITPSTDTTPPNTTISSGPPALTNSTTGSVAFTSSESPSTFRCRIDDSAYSSCGSPFSFSVSGGTHTVFVAAVDAAGNVDPTPAMRAFTIWTTPPNTVIVSGPPATGGNQNVSFTISTTSGTLPYPPGCDPRYMTCLTITYPIPTTLQCSLDGAPFTACTSPYTAGPLPFGTHVFSTRATDAAGNVDATPATHVFTITTASGDTTPPDTYLYSANPPGGGPTESDPTPTFGFVSTEAPSTAECKIEAGTTAGAAPFGPCTAIDKHVISTPLADGNYVFSVRSIDAAGNVDPSPTAYLYTLDTAAPDTTITGGPTGTTTETRPAFTYSGSSSPSYFECKLESGATAGNARFRSCTGSLTGSFTPPAALRDGTYTLSVRAYDGPNRDATPATRTFTVASGVTPTDTTEPETTITTAPAAVTSATPRFNFTSSETGSTFECKLEAADAPGTIDFGACSNGSSGFDATRPDKEGLFNFAVRAVDAAGNVDSSPATGSVTITFNTSIRVAPSGTVDTNRIHFHVFGEGPAVTSRFGPHAPTTLECKLESGSTAGSAAFRPCSGPGGYDVIPDTLTDGTYTISARATGPSGIPDPSPSTSTFTVNTTTPGTIITSAPTSPTTNTRPAIAFMSPNSGVTFECSVDYGTFFACTSPYLMPPLPERSHSFRVRSRNASGADITPASVDFTVDSSPPAMPTPSLGTCVTTVGYASCRTTANEFFDGVTGCSIDGSVNVGCGRSFIVKLPTGMHTIDATIMNDIMEIRHETYVVTIP